MTKLIVVIYVIVHLFSSRITFVISLYIHSIPRPSCLPNPFSLEFGNFSPEWNLSKVGILTAMYTTWFICFSDTSTTLFLCFVINSVHSQPWKWASWLFFQVIIYFTQHHKRQILFRNTNCIVASITWIASHACMLLLCFAFPPNTLFFIFQDQILIFLEEQRRPSEFTMWFFPSKRLKGFLYKLLLPSNLLVNN